MAFLYFVFQLYGFALIALLTDFKASSYYFYLIRVKHLLLLKFMYNLNVSMFSDVYSSGLVRFSHFNILLIYYSPSS